MRKYAPALVIDVILVIVFAALGRSSHDEGLDLVGLAGTAWPFLGGLTIGWFLTAWLYRDKFDAYAAVPTGLVLWVSTLVGGMLLRTLTGQAPRRPSSSSRRCSSVPCSSGGASSPGSSPAVA